MIILAYVKLKPYIKNSYSHSPNIKCKLKKKKKKRKKNKITVQRDLEGEKRSVSIHTMLGHFPTPLGPADGL